MVGKDIVRSEELDCCFEKLMVDEMAITYLQRDWKEIPMDLLLRILSLVDDQTVIRASEVCSGWREAICLGLTRLSLSWCKNNLNNLVLSLAPKFTKLHTLILRQYNKPQLEDNAVEAIANLCHDLQTLDLSRSFKLTDQSLYALAHGCPNLTKLNINHCMGFSDSAIVYLASFCTKLTFLSLCGCVKAATDSALQAIASNCSALQSLHLCRCENVGDLGVTSLAYGCPELRALDLRGCFLVRDESVIALVTKCHHLRSLGLYYSQNIAVKAMYLLDQSRAKNKRQCTILAYDDLLK